MKKGNTIIYRVIGILLIPSVWLTVKYAFNIEDRFLPSPNSLFFAFQDIEPNLIIHSSYSIFRLLVGFTSGIILGILSGLYFYRSKVLYEIFNPVFQSLRSIPPYATVPFFLLWFGFNESGKFIILITGIAFNLGIATYQTLTSIPDKYHVFFKSIGTKANRHMRIFTLPFVLENILPTLRFSLSTAIGLVVVAEMLGSQVGLGYLIQTAKSTFSMNVVFLAAFLFGIINYIADQLLILSWKKIVFWKKSGTT